MKNSILDIKELTYIFFKKWWIIVGITGTFFMLFLYKDYRINSNLRESYRASVKVFVGKSENIEDGYTKSELEAYHDVIDYCLEMAKIGGDSGTIDNNDDEKTSVDSIINGVIYSVNETIPVITISYTGSDKNQVKEMVNTAANDLKNNLSGVMKNICISKISDTEVTTVFPKHISRKKKGIIIGIILSIGLILALDYMDTSIRNKNELEKILEIPVIGTIKKYGKREGSEIVSFK